MCVHSLSLLFPYDYTTPSVFLPSRKRLFPSFRLTMQTGPWPVPLIFYILVKMDPPLLLSSSRMHLVFWERRLQSAFTKSFALACLLTPHLCRSIFSAIRFKELRPFVNVTTTSRNRIYAEKFKHHVMWQGQNHSVIFTMLGSVQACHLIQPTTIGQHICKAITIIPYGEAWRRFQVLLGELYGQGQMRGPFDYGCLLTLSGRREGYSSGKCLSSFLPVFLMTFLFSNPRCIWHVRSCHAQEEREGVWRLWCCCLFGMV